MDDSFVKVGGSPEEVRTYRAHVSNFAALQACVAGQIGQEVEYANKRCRYRRNISN